MVKLQDGSLVSALDLLNGSGEDEEGKTLKFEEIRDESGGFSRYEAKSDTVDGSNKTRTYTFGLGDANVKVTVTSAPKETVKAKRQETKPQEVKEDETDSKVKLSANQPSAKPTQENLTTEKAYKFTPAQPENKKKSY